MMGTPKLAFWKETSRELGFSWHFWLFWKETLWELAFFLANFKKSPVFSFLAFLERNFKGTGYFGISGFLENKLQGVIHTHTPTHTIF